MLRRRKGATGTEQGLLVGLIAVVLIAVLILLGTNLSEVLFTARDCLAGETCELDLGPVAGEETPVVSPDPIPPVLDAALGHSVTSGAITLSGFTKPITLKVSAGAELLVDGQASGMTATLAAPGSVELRATSAATPETEIVVAFVAGGAVRGWRIVTGDVTPDLSLSDLTGQVPGSLAVSPPLQAASYSLPLPLSVDAVDEAEVSLDGTDWGQGPVTLAAGASFYLRQRVPATSDGTCAAEATVTLGSVTDTWRVCAADTSPDFDIEATVDADPLTPVESQPFQLRNMDLAAPAQVLRVVESLGADDLPQLHQQQGGAEGAWTPVTLPASLPVDAQLKLTWNAGPVADGVARRVELTVGGIAREWVVATKDATPSVLSPADVTGAQLGSTHVGEASVFDYAWPTEASVAGNDAGLSLAAEGPWTETLTLQPPAEGESRALYIRQTAAGTEDTDSTAHVVLNAGAGAQTAFTVATGHASPVGFAFTDIPNATGGSPQESNAVTLAGMTVPAPFTLTGGDAVLVANGSVLEAGDLVPVNASIRLRMTAASGSAGGQAQASLTIGWGTPVTWTVTTEDLAAETFVFAAKTGLGVGAEVTSDPAQITGISRRAAISVTGEGEPGPVLEVAPASTGPWSVASGIDDGEWLRVRGQTAGGDDAERVFQVTVGSGAAVDFSTRTGTRVPSGLSDFPAIANASGWVSSAPVTLGGMSLAASSIQLAPVEGSFPVRLGILGQNNDEAYITLPGSIPANATIFLAMEAAPGQSGEARSARLTIHGQEAEWTVTNRDATPEAMAFAPIAGVAGGSPQQSEIVDLTGSTSWESQLRLISASQGAAPLVRVAAAGQDITAVSFTALNASGPALPVGSRFQLQVQAPPEDGEPRTVTVAVGARQATWSVTSRDTQVSLDFPARNAQPLATLIESDALTLAEGDIGAPSPLGLAGEGAPALRLGNAASGSWGAWQSVAAVEAGVNIQPGQSIQLRTTSAAAQDTPVLVRLTVGGSLSTWEVSTGRATPDAFVFAPTNGVAGGSAQSVSTPLAGMTLPAPYTLTPGATLSSVPPLTGDNRIPANATVTLQMAAAPGANRETRSATLTLNPAMDGGRAGTWTITNIDTTPDGYAGFGERQGQVEFAQVESDWVTISGLTHAATASVTGPGGANAQIVREGDAAGWTAANLQVTDGQRLKVRLTASGNSLEWREATVTVGGVAGTFRIRTQGSDSQPASFEIPADPNQEPGLPTLSQVVTPEEFDRPVDVAFVGAQVGDPWISVDGAPAVKSAQLLPGQSFTLTVTAPAFSQSVTNRIRIGRQDAGNTLTLPEANWVVTTRARDDVPDTVTFADRLKVPANGWVESADVIPAGFRDATRVTIVAGTDAGSAAPQFAINAGASPNWQDGSNDAAPVMLNYGDRIRIRVRTRDPDGLRSSAVLRFAGNNQTEWRATTIDTMPDANIWTVAETQILDRIANCCQCIATKEITGIDTPAPFVSASCTGSGGPGIYSGGAHRSPGGLFLQPNEPASLCVHLSEAMPSEQATCTYNIGGRQFTTTYRMVDSMPNPTYSRQLPFYTSLAAGQEIVTPWYVPHGAKSGNLVGVSPGSEVQVGSASEAWHAGTGASAVYVPLNGQFRVRSRAPAGGGSARVDVYQGNSALQQYFTVSTEPPRANNVTGNFSSGFPSQTTFANNTHTTVRDTTIGGNIAGYGYFSMGGDINHCVRVTLQGPAFYVISFANVIGSAHITNLDFGLTSTSGIGHNYNDGLLCPNESLRIDVSAPSVAGQSVGARLTLGDPNAPLYETNFVYTLGGPTLTTAANFSPPSLTAQLGNATVSVSDIAVTDFNATVQMSVTGEPSAQASVDGGATWGRNLTISPGQRLALRMTSGAPDGVTRTASVTIGTGAARNWSVTTVDTTPAAIAYSDLINQTPGRETQTMEARQITGIDTPVQVTVTGPGATTVYVNNQPRSSGLVSPNERLSIAAFASQTYGETREFTIQVGSLPAFPWRVTTREQDSEPNAFSFTPRTATGLGTQEDSAPIRLSGFRDPVPVTVSTPNNTGAPVLLIDGVASGQSATLANTSQTLAVRLTAPSVPGASIEATVNAGGVTATFTLTAPAGG